MDSTYLWGTRWQFLLHIKVPISCIGALLIGPYITRFIRHMGLLQETDHLSIIGVFATISFETLRSMGMLQHTHETRGVEYRFWQSTASTFASDVPPLGKDIAGPPPPASTSRPRSRLPPNAPD